MGRSWSPGPRSRLSTAHREVHVVSHVASLIRGRDALYDHICGTLPSPGSTSRRIHCSEGRVQSSEAAA